MRDIKSWAPRTDHSRPHTSPKRKRGTGNASEGIGNEPSLARRANVAHAAEKCPTARITLAIALLAFVLAACGSATAAETVWLSSLDLGKMSAGWGKPLVDKAVQGKPMAIAGQKFERGVGTHAASKMYVDLGGGCESLKASVGVDDEVNGNIGSVEFRIYSDGTLRWRSGVMKAGQAAKPVDVNLHGADTLLLIVDPAGDGIAFDHADWAEARFEVTGMRPKATAGPWEAPYLLTPKPASAPRINGPTIYGCRPTHPFLYRIPTTGQRPIAFAAEGLPDGLKVDPQTGIITGCVEKPGKYSVTLKATSAAGTAQRPLRIVCGETLALTPTMGWNHWYAHYDRVTDKLVREAADQMVKTGMADVGYQYVSIDDCWMNSPKNADPLRVGPLRDAKGNIVPNKHFPDMKALTATIHAKGLKAGIYTSPGPLTCGGFAGAYQHEAQDARLFAEWGFDLLKYDWCSYGEVVKGKQDLDTFKKPYTLMGGILKKQDRDIVMNLCQYGMGDVWKWGAEVGGQSWRTAGDLGFELNRIFEVALANAEHRAWSRPGSWNDPDYIQIGYIGEAATGGEPKPCPITPSEQYSFMSLWCLMASPLFYSGDMNRLDEFTLNVLCNPEVIEVDQDALGQSARVVPLGEETFAMVKDLEDGSKAVGLFNRGELPAEVTAKWSALGLSGIQRVRDLWRQKDVGELAAEFSAKVPRHGCAMLRVRAK
jgi:alpha-galactosidase